MTTIPFRVIAFTRSVPTGAKKEEPAEPLLLGGPATGQCGNNVRLAPVQGASPDANPHSKTSQVSEEGERYKLILVVLGLRPNRLVAGVVLQIKFRVQPLMLSGRVDRFNCRKKQVKADRSRPPPAVAGPPRKPERPPGYNPAMPHGTCRLDRMPDTNRSPTVFVKHSGTAVAAPRARLRSESGSPIIKARQLSLHKRSSHGN